MVLAFPRVAATLGSQVFSAELVLVEGGGGGGGGVRGPSFLTGDIMFAFASSRGWLRGDVSVASFQDDSCGEFNFAKVRSGTKAEGLCQGPVVVFTGRLRWTCVMRHGNRGRVVVIGGDIRGFDRTGE